MFTGLIEDVGKVIRWHPVRKAGRLTFSTRLSSREMPMGSSIAVNGTCLTVVQKFKGRIAVDVSPETLERTNLKGVKVGDPVNLERPLRLSGRLGGHLVTGHVDGVGTVKTIKKKGDFAFFQIQVSSAMMRLIVPKGSVALDGMSLTVNECEDRTFSVAIIPFTLKHTNLHRRGVGDKVNIETDLVGKYVQKLLKTGNLRRAKRST